MVTQISKELKQYHHVEKLDDVRVIKDRQTSTSSAQTRFADLFLLDDRGVSRLWLPKICDFGGVEGFRGAQLSNDLPLWK